MSMFRARKVGPLFNSNDLLAFDQAARRTSKRKRDVLETEEKAELEKREAVFAARRADAHQFWQGKTISELPEGLGCGQCTLISPWVACNYPAPKEMWLEVMKGTTGPGGGSIRMCGSRKNWSVDAIWLMPFQHIEQVIVLPSAEEHRVIIVPSDATGFSPLKRRYPQLISFSWPDRKADEKLKLTFKEVALDDDTYLSILKRKLDELLAPFGKQVMDLTNQEQRMVHCSAILSHCERLTQEGGSHCSPRVNGQVYFLETGWLFLSDTTRLYLPFHSLTSTIFLEPHKCQEGYCTVSMDVYEPCFQDREEDRAAENSSQDDSISGSSVGIICDKLPRDMHPKIFEFLRLEARKFTA